MKSFRSRRADLSSPRDLIRNQIGLQEYSSSSKEGKKIGKMIQDIFGVSSKSPKKKSKILNSNPSTSTTTSSILTNELTTANIFCGTVPLEHFTPNDFQSSLLRNSYYVSENHTSSCRYLLFAHRHLGVFLINQQSIMIKVDINLPVPTFTTEGTKTGAGGRQHYTLLDGELTYQTLAGGRTEEIIFFISDAIRIDGQDVHRLPLNERLAAVHARVLSPRQLCQNPSMVAKLRKEKIRVQMKPIHHVSECKHLLRCQELKELKELKMKNNSTSISSTIQEDLKNGLLFLPIDLPYMQGTSLDVFKWQRVITEEVENDIDDIDDIDELEDLDFDDDEESEELNIESNQTHQKRMTIVDLYRIMEDTGQDINRFTLPKEELEISASNEINITTNTTTTNTTNSTTASATSATPATPALENSLPIMSSEETNAMLISKQIRSRLMSTLNPNIGKIDESNHYMIGSEEMVKVSNQSPPLDIAYYQDINKSWPFYTSKNRGLELLSQLVQTCNLCLARNSELMESSEFNAKQLEESGKDIYRNKPTFKRTRDSKEFGDAQFVTWSQEEYANLGLQRQYLKLKSYQRFTEAWSLLERADARGLFDDFLNLSKSVNYAIPLRIASVGGGPGFELFACQEYFNYRTDKKLILELTSMDYEKTWGEYARLMGFRFIHYDLKTGRLLNTLGYKKGQLHFVIFSAVMEMYVANDVACDWLSNLLLKEGVIAAMVDSRSQKLKAHRMMEQRGITAVALLPSSGSDDCGPTGDERQSLLIPPTTKILPMDNIRSINMNKNCVFPNVPFAKKSRKNNVTHCGTSRSSSSTSSSYKKRKF